MTEAEVPGSGIARRLYWPAVVALFLVVHVTVDRCRSIAGLPVAPGLLAAVKLDLFVPAFAVLAAPLLARLARKIDARESARALAFSVCAAVILFALVRYLGNDSMGEVYSRISLDPFAQATGVYNRRFLMPALAHLLFLRGFWPYYLFSVALGVIFIALLYDWCRRSTSLRGWQILSLCTSSFVIFQFQCPGYPDTLLYILMILVMGERLDQEDRLTLLVLALLVHESSVFVCSLLALRYLDRRGAVAYFAAVAGYCLILFAANGFDVGAVCGKHTVAGKSALAWVLDAPFYEVMGLAMAFKALWLVAAAAAVQALRGRNSREALFIAAVMMSGVLVTLLGVDTSRLAAFAFPGILVSLSVLTAPRAPATERALAWLFGLNILIPSVYVGLNSGFVVREGLYNLVFQSLQSALR